MWVANGIRYPGSVRWMPRHQEPKKDVVSCEKPRGAASERRSVDVRMGKPGRGHALSPPDKVGRKVI